MGGANCTNDGKEEEEPVVDHSLKKVCCFSTKKKQMAAPSKEGLLTMDKNNGKTDRRIKIVYRDIHFNVQSYRSLCQIRAKLPCGMSGIGSCQMVSVNSVANILTCAHNLAGVSTRDRRMVMYKEGYMYCGRQGEKKWRELCELQMKSIRVHPMYDGQPDSGFDIGVCPLSQQTTVNVDRSIYPKSVKNDVSYGSAKPESIKKGMKVEVAGYPGEKGGFPYTHTGEIVDVVKTTHGGYLLYYNADATPGNSGSAIMITDESYVKRFGVSKVTVGVHTGHDDIEGLNFGTLITPSLMKWIQGDQKEVE